jgi:hypothetical protein
MAIIKCPVCETDIDLHVSVASQKEKALTSTDINRFLEWNNSINGSIPSYWDCWQAAISTVKK